MLHVVCGICLNSDYLYSFVMTLQNIAFCYRLPDNISLFRINAWLLASLYIKELIDAFKVVNF